MCLPNSPSTLKLLLQFLLVKVAEYFAAFSSGRKALHCCRMPPWNCSPYYAAQTGFRCLNFPACARPPKSPLLGRSLLNLSRLTHAGKALENFMARRKASRGAFQGRGSCWSLERQKGSWRWSRRKLANHHCPSAASHARAWLMKKDQRIVRSLKSCCIPRPGPG